MWCEFDHIQPKTELESELLHEVEGLERALDPLGGLPGSLTHRISGGGVIKFAQHKDLKLIAWKRVDV